MSQNNQNRYNPPGARNTTYNRGGHLSNSPSSPVQQELESSGKPRVAYDERKPRGGWRPRYGQRGNSNGYRGKPHGYSGTRWQPRVEPPPKWLDDRGELMYEIKLGGTPETIPASRITGVKLLASYNWLQGKGATMLVPGSPPVWRPTPSNDRLQEDEGSFFRDINAAHYAPFPTEPAFRSVLLLQPSFKVQDLDIVACGSTIGNLLRFSSGIERSFRFDIDVAGNTVFFVRKENSPTELIPDVRGFGHRFLEVNTEWVRDVKGSESHQRIVTYDFAGMKMLVRFESDGYLEDMLDSDKPENEKETENLKKTKDGTSDDLDSLTSALAGVTVTTNSTVPPDVDSDSKDSTKLKIIHAGTLIPQRAVFDLKTRSTRREIDLTEVHRRLWVTQTPNFISGHHFDGVFEEIRIQEIQEDLRKFEDENQEVLWRVASTMRRIAEMVRGSNRKRFELTRVGGGPIEIRRRREGEGERRVLPEELLRLWGEGEKVEIESPKRGEIKSPLSRVDLDDDFDDFYESDYDDNLANLDFTACSADDCGYCGKCDY